jgi:branched-chain amino acid transport system substrate-binding protein
MTLEWILPTTRAKQLLSLMIAVPLLLTSCAALLQPGAASGAAGNGAATATAANGADSAAAGEPIYIGVSGPLTGQNARYGEQWKKGFDLALEEVNGGGGIDGRPLEYVFEDSQSDPKQSVVVAQKFVADPRIIVELGDFSSGASMAASPIYQRGGLVQFGFTNSHPDFTKLECARGGRLVAAVAGLSETGRASGGRRFHSRAIPSL